MWAIVSEALRRKPETGTMAVAAMFSYAQVRCLYDVERYWEPDLVGCPWEEAIGRSPILSETEAVVRDAAKRAPIGPLVCVDLDWLERLEPDFYDRKGHSDHPCRTAGDAPIPASDNSGTSYSPGPTAASCPGRAERCSRASPARTGARRSRSSTRPACRLCRPAPIRPCDPGDLGSVGSGRLYACIFSSGMMRRPDAPCESCTILPLSPMISAPAYDHFRSPISGGRSGACPACQFNVTGGIFSLAGKFESDMSMSGGTSPCAPPGRTVHGHRRLRTGQFTDDSTRTFRARSTLRPIRPIRPLTWPGPVVASPVLG